MLTFLAGVVLAYLVLYVTRHRVSNGLPLTPERRWFLLRYERYLRDVQEEEHG